MLKVYVAGKSAGSLFKPESDQGRFHFRYDEQCPPQFAVSLTMPVAHEHYASDYKTLHPVFDMNLPEGMLAERLRREFGKAIPNFDDLALLKIVGKSQIGRLRFAMPGEEIADVPAEDIGNLLAHDGAEGLFESLLNRYAIHSGISGAMPKVMVRASEHVDNRVTHRGATHIIKAWTDEFPRLAENEYFCMRAAMHADLEVPKFELTSGGKFLVLERFDLEDDVYLGFEDFCSLHGNTTDEKYNGSYEGIVRRIRDFVSPEQLCQALERFYKALVLSCALRNGDAHLKNFGVLYADTESAVRLAPIYDLVTTTVYMPEDILALTLGGTKRWPKADTLVNFARTHCNITNVRIKMLMQDVAIGVLRAAWEMQRHMREKEAFREVGNAMLAEWNKGWNFSVQPEDQPIDLEKELKRRDELIAQRRQARKQKAEWDAEWLQLHQLAVDALSNNDAKSQAVREHAFSQIDKWEKGALCSRCYIDEWRRILNLPFSELAQAILRNDVEGIALRQNTPFGFMDNGRGETVLYPP